MTVSEDAIVEKILAEFEHRGMTEYRSVLLGGSHVLRIARGHSAYVYCDVIGDTIRDLFPSFWVTLPERLRRASYSERAEMVLSNLSRSGFAYQPMRNHWEISEADPRRLINAIIDSMRSLPQEVKPCENS